MTQLFQCLWQRKNWGEWSIRQSIFCQPEYKVKSPMLRSNLRDYSDAYIIMTGTKYIGIAGNNDRTQKDIVF